MRVCHVVNAVDTTSVPADIATGLVKYTDVDADILAWFAANEFDGDDLVEVHCVQAPDTVWGANASTLRAAYDLIREYDIVQTHHNHSGTFAKILARRASIPVVSTEQNNHYGFTRKGRIANGLTNALADSVTCVSESVYESIRRWEWLFLDESNVRVIHNGVSFDRIERALETEWSVHDIDDSAFLVGNAAMLTEQKAHDTLIRAIARSEEDPHLVIAGDGPKRGYLEDIARETGVADRVHFLGLIDRQHVYSLMAEVDAYAMPSRWEGFSAAAIEALAVGTPCVFSDIDEFKLPYEDIALFHPVDDADALAARIDELAGNDDYRHGLATDSREFARQYSIENVAGKYRDLYETIVEFEH